LAKVVPVGSTVALKLDKDQYEAAWIHSRQETPICTDAEMQSACQVFKWLF
jgi:hypothetical protein